MILKSFRDASHSFVIKILFAAIILSFCLWGVGDIIKNYASSKAVFTVERERFTVDQFLREYSQEKQRIRNIGSKPLSDAELERLNIKGLVLDKLVNSAVLEQIYGKLGIVIPKKTLINVVHSLPQFQRDGMFNSRMYEMTIRRSGMSEQGFLQGVRDNLARTQLLHPIVAGYKIPTIVKDIIAKDFESKYTVLVSKVDLNSIACNSDVGDAELRQYYDNNPDRYKKTETRDVSILLVDYSKLAKGLVVDEAEVDAIYNNNKESYKSAETRDFERFTFEDRRDANKAWELLNRGTPTRDVIKKLTPDMEEVREAKQSDFPEKVGKDLFSLKKGNASDVYELNGRFYIYRLMNVTSNKGRSVAEIKSEIRDELRSDMLNSPEFYLKIKDMKNKIDDGFGSGKSIDVIAQETGMQIRKLSGLKLNEDRKDLTEIIPDADTRSEVLAHIFKTDAGQASQTIDSHETDTLSYVVVVDNVQPSVVPEFDTIKDQVKRDYILEKMDESLVKDLNEITEDSKTAISQIKKKFKVNSFKFSKKDILTQQTSVNPEVSRILKLIPNPNFVLHIMSNLKNGGVEYHKISDTEYLVCGIASIDKSQQVSKDSFDVVSQYIDSGTANDVVSSTLEAFKKTMKIKIDSKLVDEVTKTSDELGGD